jgi:hypothetical protein
MKRKFVRTKPSIRIKKTKFGIDIIKTIYDDFGKIMKKQVETIKIDKKKR